MNNKKQKEEEYLLKTVILEISHHWCLFAISLVLFLGLAFLYNKYTAPVYNTGLKLMVTTLENNRNRNIRPEEFLQGFQLVQHTKEIENEMVILQSLPLIKETIKNLNLKVSYFFKENLVPYHYWPFYNYPNLILREMYENVPFEIVLDEQHPQPVGVFFYIKIINDKEFSVSIDARNVKIYDYQNDITTGVIDRFSLHTTASFGDTIRGPYYSFRVLLNSKYNQQFENEDLYFSFQSINTLVRIYQSNLTVEQSNLESSIVNIYFKGQNIQKSIDFLNELANTYIQRGLSKKNYIAETTIEYIDRELSNISSSLNQAEGQLQYFRSKHQVMDIDQKNIQLSQYIQTLENHKNEILQNLRFYKELYKYFEENQNATNMLAPSSMGVNDQVLNSMIERLATYNAQRNEMEKKHLERNPRYKTLTNQIKDLRSSISGNIRFYIRSTQSKLDEINANLERYKLQERQLPQTQRQLLGYERKFNLSNEIYNFLLQKRAEAQIAKSSIIPDSEVIEPATYKGIYSPKTMLNYTFAFFLAFLIPGGFLFMKVYLNNKITRPDEIKAITSVKIIGKILHNNQKTYDILTEYPHLPVAESFRALRTNLNFLLKEKNRQVILITSSTSGEGKTFISYNLATSLSLLRKKVILLGFDLRKSEKLDKLFETNDFYGLSDYLIDNTPVQNYIHPSSIKNLDFILSGTPAPNPSELIESGRTYELFRHLRSKYDYIIVDTPPVGLVADPYLLMKYSDINLFIVRGNFTPRKELEYIMEEFGQNDFIKISFIVLNDIHHNNTNYAYKNYYTSYKKRKMRKFIFKKKQDT